MTVGVFYRKGAKQMHRTVLDAMRAGIPEETKVGCMSRYVKCDIAVVWGIEKKAHPGSAKQYRALFSQHRRHGGKVLVLERGFLHRDRYYMAGWDGLNGRANFANERVTDRRRFLELGIKIQPWQDNPDGHVLLAGQVPWDSSVQPQHKYRKWLNATIKTLSRTTDRKIVFRPHPSAKSAVGKLSGAAPSRGSLESDMEGAWCVVTYNSNVAVEAIIAGIPAITMDPGSMAWDVTAHTLEDVAKPPRPFRDGWAARLAYAQWTTDEMAAGKAWEHLKWLIDTADNGETTTATSKKTTSHATAGPAGKSPARP